MNGKLSTWQDLLARRSLDSCVGRAPECETFRLNFLYPVPRYLVFAVIGDAGLGKSALLQHFQAIAAEQDAITVIADGQHHTVDCSEAILKTLASLEIQLGAAGTPLTSFREQYDQYRAFVRDVADDPEAPGSWLGLVGGWHDADPWVRQAWDAYLARRLPHRAMLDLVREPVKTLTDTFVRELNAWAIIRHFVLCFDDWHLTEPCLGDWLCDLLLFGALSLRVWVCVAGRVPLASSWKALQPVMASFELNPLSSEEMRSYVEMAGIGDPVRLRDVVTFAGGSPVWARLLMSVEGGTAGDLALTPLDRYLKWLTDPLERNAVLRCSAARHLTPAVIAALLDSPGDLSLGEVWQDRLMDASVLVETSAGPAMPAVFRKALHAYAQQAAPAALRSAHAALYRYYRGQTLDSHPQSFCDPDYRAAVVEALYHGLMLEEPLARREGVRMFLAALRYYLPLAGELAAAWRQASAEQAIQNDTTRLAVVFGEGWEIAQSRDWEAALAFCEGLPGQLPSEIAEAPEVQRALEEILQRIASRIPQAPGPAPAALAAASSALPQATVTDEQPAPEPETEAGELDHALPLVSPAPAGIPEPAPVDAEAVSEALQPLTADVTPSEPAPLPEPAGAVPADRLPEPPTAAELARLADGALRNRDYRGAIRDYTRVLELDATLWAPRYHRALAYLALGENTPALEDLNRVLAINPDYAPAYRDLGLVHSRLGRLSAALIDYDRAIELDPGNAGLYAGRGNIHHKLNAYDLAIADYDQAIRLSPTGHDAYLNRGLAYAAQGAYVQAIADYGQALALQPELAVAYHYRGQAYARLAQYAQALEDYALALSLNPDYVAVYVSQGLVYAREQDFAQAIEAHERAIALDPSHAPAWYNAACAAALAGDVERACSYLRQAIQLRPSYRQMAVRDADFARISQSSEFQALISDDSETGVV